MPQYLPYGRSGCCCSRHLRVPRFRACRHAFGATITGHNVSTCVDYLASNFDAGLFSLDERGSIYGAENFLNEKRQA
jgi:hypothetical protein